MRENLNIIFSHLIFVSVGQLIAWLEGWEDGHRKFGSAFFGSDIVDFRSTF